MNRDDVIRMALEAGFAYRPEDDHVVVEGVHGYSEAVVTAGLERFAAAGVGSRSDANQSP